MPASRLAIVVAVVLVLGWRAVVATPGPPGEFTLTAIDVGQGDAILVETPRVAVLIDAGEDGRAAEWLARSGRGRIDLAVVTHAHLDHVGGMDEVVATLEVGMLWLRPMPTDRPEQGELLALAAARGVPVRAPERGRTVTLADLTVEVLHPPPGRPFADARSELNESSLVLRLSAGGRRVLVAGDTEAGAHARLLAGDRALLAAEVLVVPHHGSRTSDLGLLTAVGPQVAVLSVGAGNPHGHPHREVLDHLAGLGVEVRRTDREGTVRITVPPPAAGASDPVTTLGAPDRPTPAARGARPRDVAAARRGGRRPAARPRGRAAPGGAPGRRPDPRRVAA